MRPVWNLIHIDAPVYYEPCDVIPYFFCQCGIMPASDITYLEHPLIFARRIKTIVTGTTEVL
jgi:hypothetical protein